MGYETITYLCEGGRVLVTMNRPGVMNAMTTTMRAELCDAFTRAGAEARVVVLTGAGRGFCAGQDLADRAGDRSGFDAERALNEEYAPMLRALAAIPVPVIAAVNGVAAGAGASLALSCDLVVAAESAVFLQAFSRIGLVPDAGATWLLPRQVGMPRAMGMALLAGKVPARQAAEWGMIWEAVPDDAFVAQWQQMARALAEGPTEAYRRTKAALRAAQGNDYPAQLALEARLQGEAARTADFAEGVAAFLEKRAARFEGR